MTTKQRKRGTRGNEAHETAVPLAVRVLRDRILLLPVDDRKDLVKLVKELSKTEPGEEMDSIISAIEEILEQAPARAIRMELPKEPKIDAALRKWVDYVGGRIREQREKAGLTQQKLAELAGLPQSHVSRIECGKHSPSHSTVQKIATALGISAEWFDPSA